MYRRYYRSQEAEADAERQEEEEEERVPLLQRCRNYLSHRNEESGPSVFDRFRAVIFGGRANLAGPEVPQLDAGAEEGHGHGEEHDEERRRQEHHGEEHNRYPEPSAPPAHSAPPPPYEAVNRNPIIRAAGSVANENYAGSGPSHGSRDQRPAVEMREISANQSRSVQRMDEIPLSKSLQ